MPKPKESLGFKIRHTKTNLYLTSMYRNKWSRVGKVWSRESDMIRSINMGIKNIKTKAALYGYKNVDDILDDISNWEVIKLTEKDSYSALFILNKLRG